VIGVARRRAVAVLGINLAVVAVACSGGSHPHPAPAPAVVATTTSTTLVDHSTDSLPSIAGETTVPAVAVTPGAASMTGTVLDDTGAAVPGATVGLQRIVGSQLAQTTVVAGPTGTWVAQGILGGLYRVRAWRPPDLAEPTPQVLFLADSGTQTLNLTVDHYTGISVAASVAPNPPIIGEPANIAVEVSGATVSSDGVVRSQGQPNVEVNLFGEGQWQVAGGTTELTSSSGLASWQATCESLGQQSLSVLVNGTQAFPLSLPSCYPVPTTTTSTSTTSTTLGRGETTTTRPGPKETTTTRA
jgi:hypothetical protein